TTLFRSFLDLALERFQKQAHETADLLRRPSPVLAREGEQRQGLHAAARALIDAHAHRREPGAVSGRARQAARRSPAAVAVHGDRDVPGRELGGGGDHHTCMTSFSLAASSASMSAMCLSVSFCTSVSARRSSSCETSFSFSISLMSFMTSRRTLRTATRALSASCRRTLLISRRRSSVGGGMGIRITVPAVMGVSPRSGWELAC